MKLRIRSDCANSRGSATLVAVVAVAVLLGLTGAMLAVTHRTQGERVASVDRHRSLYAANSGIAHVLTNLHSGADPATGVTEFAGANYDAAAAANDDGTFTITSTGVVRAERVTLEAVVGGVGSGVYHNAIFAGNTDGDPLYTLALGGSGQQADHVEGDIYSGQHVDLTGDADIDGTIRAQGLISGGTGESGVSLPVPDLPAMDYENTSDFDVGALFSDAFYARDDAGGSAYQVEESNPAHIFRKNPSDRSSDTSSTQKDDYFLEDPYEDLTRDSGSTGEDAYAISLSGVSGAPGVDGNNKVYFIDGNLWLHNIKVFSMKIKHAEANGVKVTFVVKGNIYFSDNLFYQDTDTDGVAFIAMKDDTVEDSGNIYFGDPVFGTLEQMHAFMYAENNFHDNNLDANGSAQVHLYGNMTAGNQVLIQRDYGDQHSRLTVDFDDRIATGSLEMPRLPLAVSTTSENYQVLSWRRIANQ